MGDSKRGFLLVKSASAVSPVRFPTYRDGMKPEAVLETCLYATDLEAAETFYREVIGLEPFAREPGRHVFFRCGAGMLLLFNPAATAADRIEIGGGAIPYHGSAGPGHIGLRVAGETLPGWREHLRAHAVSVETEIAWPQGGASIYFRDPAGNSVELVTPQTWGLT